MDATEQRQTFGVVDYCVLGSTLLMSIMIGAFYAFRGKHTNEEMLLGNRQLRVLPVSVSVMVSFLSAIMILGVPAEMFVNGAEYWVSTLSIMIAIPVIAALYLPIFYRCRLTSVFEYIQYRFNSPALRGITVAGSLLQTTLYMGMALYAPALALSSTTPLSLEMSILGTAGVGTLYTTFGGLKAVVWADVLQACIMVAGMVAVIVQGAINVGGFTNIFYINSQHGRMNVFNFNVNVWQRHNFWNLCIGSLFLKIGTLGSVQAAVQRYNSLPTLRSAKQCCLLLAPTYLMFSSLACTCGLAIFANYADCDPLKQGLVQRKDQLVPYFVLDEMSYLTGLPGLFVACVMSGALSTISSGLNSMAAITWQDFIGNTPTFKNMSEQKQSWVLRAISFMYGCVSVGLAFVAGSLGGILQATMSILNTFGGPLLGVFTLGIFVPFSNGKGTIVGFLTALAFGMWMSFGAFSTGKRPEPIPSSVAGCEANLTSLVSSVTSTTPAPAETTPNLLEPEEELSVVEQYVYEVSYQLLHPVGCLLCVLIGSIVSLITGCNQHKVSESLVNPTAFKLLNRFNRHGRSSDLKDGVQNPAFSMPTYIETRTKEY